MADDWRIAESRDQALLYVVLRAASELAPRSDIPDVPEPLHQPVVTEVVEVIHRLVTEARDGTDYAQLQTTIAALFAANAELPVRIADSPPWNIDQVVAQWASTAQVLVAWRHAVESAHKDGHKTPEPDEQAEKRGWLRWTGSSKEEKARSGRLPHEKGKTPTQLAPSATDSNATLVKVRSLLEEVAKQALVPVLCAKHAHAFFLPDPAANGSPPQVSSEPAACREDCIRHLLEWCGDLDRLPSTTELPKDYFVKFAQAASALLGRECISHPNPGKVPIADWRNGNGFRNRPPPGQLVKVHRPPLFDVVNKAVVAKGWATTPSPEKLAGTVLEILGQEPAFPSLRQASQRALTAWLEGRRKSLADGLPRNVTEWSAGLHDGITDASALSLVRLSTMYFSGHSHFKTINEKHFRFVLLLDAQVDITITPVPQESQVVEGRLIPYSHDSTLSETPRRDKMMFKRSEWPTLDVGVLGPEVCAAPPDALAAVEDLDWRLWFLDAMRRHALVDATCSDLIDRALKRARYDSWESVKRKWMVAPATTPALEALQGHLYQARIGLAGSASLGPLGSAGTSLCNDLLNCERAVLVALKTADPRAYDRVYPPRQLDASYDIDRWMTDDVCGDPRGKGFVVRWVRSDRPFGDCLRERAIQDRSDHGSLIEITLSAGKTVEQDHRFLEAPFFIIRPDRPDGAYIAPLHRFAERIWRDSRGTTGAEIASAMDTLRSHLLSSEGDEAFHALVTAAVRGDRDAIEWVNLLRNDQRFRFECHPPVVCDDGHVAVAPASASAVLSWQDDAFVPRGGDVDISFSMAPNRARRVLSRGRPAPDAPDGLAQSIEAGLREAPDEFREIGARILEATDRWITFPSDAPHPLTAQSVAKILAMLPSTVWDDGHDLKARVVDLLSGWVAQFGHRLRPCAWHPLHGARAADSPPTDIVRFHPTTPPGNVVVERFGLDGEHALEWAGHISAGPAPAGFTVLVEASQAFSNDAPLAREVRACLTDLPRHFLAGKAPLVGPALFNAVWDLVLGAPQAVSGSGSTLTAAVAELLKASCGMILFEPTGLGEYPSAWVRGPDGKSPRGDWIVRVVRPGVRTAKNTLVWPAVVETE